MQKLLELAGRATIEQGLSLFEHKHVQTCRSISSRQYTGTVWDEQLGICYAQIHLDKPLRSSCTCMEGKEGHAICRHMIALAIQASPKFQEVILEKKSEQQKNKTAEASEHAKQLP